jgi:hypothetical protein
MAASLEILPETKPVNKGKPERCALHCRPHANVTGSRGTTGDDLQFRPVWFR